MELCSLYLEDVKQIASTNALLPKPEMKSRVSKTDISNGQYIALHLDTYYARTN